MKPWTKSHNSQIYFIDLKDFSCCTCFASYSLMELSRGCRYWSVLQAVVIVVYNPGKVSSERSQGCVGSQLRLECPEMKVIDVKAVVLGDSECYWSSCCINDDDCTSNANLNHRTDVYRRCDNKRSCSVNVLYERIRCGTFGAPFYNDFERITYDCKDDPQRSTRPTSTTWPSRPSSREVEDTPDEETENGQLDNTTSAPDEQNTKGSDQDAAGRGGNDTQGDKSPNSSVLPVVMATICFLVLVAIIVTVVILRRKKWSKLSASIEMIGIDGNDQNEDIYANDNQAMSLNNGSASPIYSNDKIKKSRDKKAETYEVANNVVHSITDDAGSRPSATDPKVNCDVEGREPDYLIPSPRSDVYSVVRETSNDDNNVYSEVVTREPAADVYDEACKWRESEYKATVETDKAKKTSTSAHRTTPASYANVSIPSKTAPVVDSKAEVRDRASTSDGFPTPTYETMSPGIPEGIYANEPALSPAWSLPSKTLSTAGSETESLYCDMQSPKLRFKDDGSQTVVENDLYGH